MPCRLHLLLFFMLLFFLLFSIISSSYCFSFLLDKFFFFSFLRLLFFFSCSLKQVKRNHNILADGWARASNPQLHPTYPLNTPSKLTQTSKCAILQLSTHALWTNRPKEQRTKRRTHKASYSVPCLQLKRLFILFFSLPFSSPFLLPPNLLLLLLLL